MSDRHRMLRELSRATDSKIVLLILDGVGDIQSEQQPRTPLDAARTPNLDALASRAALGRLVPASAGITPGSGPGHLALFGYEPTAPENDIGRGVLEALGLGLQMVESTVAARGNFATVDANGDLTDRRAGRIPSEECQRLCENINLALQAAGLDTDATVHPGEGYRFVLLLEGPELSPELADTDPQRLGRPPRDLEGRAPEAAATVERALPVLRVLQDTLADEERANAFLLRGFSKMPRLEPLTSLYRLRAGAFAGYPLYRGVASACGMQVIPCGKTIDRIVTTVAKHWSDFDFFFLHVKQTDMAGEDGHFDDKVAVIEDVDAALPALLELEPDTLAITADHSTPVPMKAHSWHPVPLLIQAASTFVDSTTRYTERDALSGTIGTLPASELMGVLLAEAGKLAKFGA